MRATVVLSLAVLSACASSKPGSAIASGGAEVPIGTSTFRIRPTDGPTVHDVPFDLQEVWRALPVVFDSLGITITEVDATHHVMGSPGFKAHKRLRNVALSKLIDCGSTQGFPSADEYDVNLSVLTQVEAAKAGSTSVATKVDAAARPMAFPGAYTKCSTKGLLETSIVEAVKRHLER